MVVVENGLMGDEEALAGGIYGISESKGEDVWKRDERNDGINEVLVEA